jgi:hypothetical protein
MSIDSNDPTVLRALIQRWVVPNFAEYDRESQKQILSCLEFFLAIPDNIIERVLPSCQVPIEPLSGRYFFSLIWRELVGKDFDPSSVNCSDYDVVPGVTLANSLKKNEPLNNS